MEMYPWLLKAHKLFFEDLFTSHITAVKNNLCVPDVVACFFFQPINTEKMMFVLSITSCICFWSALCRTPWLMPCKISASLSGFVHLQMFWRNKKPTQCDFDTTHLYAARKTYFFLVKDNKCQTDLDNYDCSTQISKSSPKWGNCWSCV